MFAHVNVWRLSEEGSSTDDTAAREIGTRLAQQQGFRSYTAIRTGEHEVVAVTIFDTEDHLRQAVQALAGFVHERLAPLVQGAQERHRGDVLYHTTA
jgi:heme-degrading monooxygenase HmoA